MRTFFIRFMIVASAMTAAACGGKGTSPTSPSNTGGTTPGTSSAATATITGSVQGAASSLTAFNGGAAITGVTVTVVGTSISANADAAGRFTLTNVPVGDVQLLVTGGGANSMVQVGAVLASQTIDLVVTVSGSTASIDSQVKSGGGEAELEGRVESLPPTTAALTFKAAGRTVKTDSATQFIDGSLTRSFGDLQIGMRVHARGSLAGDAFTATRVELQNVQVTVPVEVNGTIDTLTGSATAFQFKIGSRVVKGDANTTFFGDGDKPDTFSDLKNGSRVEVKGQQRDGFVYAARVHIDGSTDTPGGGQDDSASIQGTLVSMSGSKPNLVLLVGSTTVRTSSATEVKRRGDVQTLDTLKVGQTLHVEGARQSDGSLNARKIEIDDDPVGGEFEVEGALGGLKGACPSVQFAVNGFSISTSASTSFEIACSSLKSGDNVNVKGTRQADGSVAATRVK